MKTLCVLAIFLVGVAIVAESAAVRQLTSGCPMMCTANYDPVCGTNGKTYSNTCAMNVDACVTQTTITVAHRGRCGSGH